MAQLNDLIVLGNSNLVGETNINGNLNINSDVAIKNTLSVEGTTYLKNNIELTRTSNTNNPYLKLASSSGSAYLQLNGTSIGIGNGWTNSLQIDSSGNATLPGNMTAGGTTIALGASANIIGTTKQATTVSNQLVLQQGAVFSGTAANAGLVTRGICGVSTPDSNGACSKDNLYINYDSTNDYNASRQLVLQAGSIGTHYGSNLYQYAAARGDAVKGWVENNATSASAKKLATARTLTIGNNGKTFDGSANVSWSLSEIGADPAGTAKSYYDKIVGDGRTVGNCVFRLQAHGIISAGNTREIAIDNSLAYGSYGEWLIFIYPYSSSDGLVLSNTEKNLTQIGEEAPTGILHLAKIWDDPCIFMYCSNIALRDNVVFSTNSGGNNGVTMNLTIRNGSIKPFQYEIVGVYNSN